MYFRMEQFCFEVITIRSEKAIVEHVMILDAIKNAYAVEAYKAYMDHLEKVRAKILEAITENRR